MVVAEQEAETPDDGTGNRRPDDGDDLKQAGDGAEHDGVRHAHEAEHEGEDDGGERGKDELGANVGADHDVDVGDDAGQNALFVVGVAEVDDGDANGGCALEEEEAEDGDEDEPPDVGDGRFEAGGDGGAVAEEIGLVGHEEVLQLLLVSGAHVLGGAEAGDDLAGGHLVEERGKAENEGFALGRDLRAENDDEGGEDDDQNSVNDGDSAETAADGVFEAGDEGLKKVGEKDGEEEQREGGAGSVKEAESEQEDEGGEEDAEGAGVPELVEHFGEMRGRGGNLWWVRNVSEV